MIEKWVKDKWSEHTRHSIEKCWMWTKEDTTYGIELELDIWDWSTPYIRCCKWWPGRGHWMYELRFLFLRLLLEYDTRIDPTLYKMEEIK